MSRFKKFIWGLMGLLLIVLAGIQLVLMYNFGSLTTSLQVLMDNEISYYILTGLLVLVFLVGFIMLISAIVVPSWGRLLWLQQDKGRLKISKTAVISLVQQSLAQHFNLTEVVVSPKLIDRQKQIELKVQAVTFNTSNLSEQGNQIRTQIVNDIENYLGVPVKRVNLQLKQAAKGQKVPVI
ncbi:alkaline shock response membrane anchor protein AmaP [Paucilactobacillus kaifaensis]|uniref:alkaline shock response membrane anchor protein AmaP n=1 Tax=Paucilactobacillus kaifaensis TaxID=2559921 RepID=UPI0010F44C1D|nr:alkaline shock response membrane anchor protein AmaP [Paucilactobacillus kaifaensis]